MDTLVARTDADGRRFNRSNEEVIACKQGCGRDTTMDGTGLCDGCWEANQRAATASTHAESSAQTERPARPAIIPQNKVAATVLDHLPGSEVPSGGYFGGHTYCIGIPVRNVAAAFNLGAAMGAETTDFGSIGFDVIGNQSYVVFRDARVSQGPA